jgi:uncharacterized protein (UPF0212 family)
VCVWDPSHTLQRFRAQEAAREDGTLARLIAESSGDKHALRAALCKAGLVSMSRSLSGDVHCPECGTLMESVFASPGIEDMGLAYQDVVENFVAALERTRRMR